MTTSFFLSATRWDCLRVKPVREKDASKITSIFRFLPAKELLLLPNLIHTATRASKHVTTQNLKTFLLRILTGRKDEKIPKKVSVYKFIIHTIISNGQSDKDWCTLKIIDKGPRFTYSHTITTPTCWEKKRMFHGDGGGDSFGVEILNIEELH